MVFAHTMVLAPNHGASSLAAAISAPRLAMPTQNTTISSSGARLVVTRETYRPYLGQPFTSAGVVGSSGTSTSLVPGPVAPDRHGGSSYRSVGSRPAVRRPR